MTEGGPTNKNRPDRVLVSLNIQRGRDHGLPSYNDMREKLGLGRVSSFEGISSDSEVQDRLEAAYGDVDCVDPYGEDVDCVDRIDLWVGGLAEDRVPGALVGPTFRAILIDQFERLRDGDRFWYQNVFSESEQAELESTTLSMVIVRNTDIKAGEIGSNVFLAP
jgi:peroxidase